MPHTTAAAASARFARQLSLPGFGAAAQGRLEQARVLVIGAGGLGSAVLPALAAAGVGTIGVIDDDRVELSNLHRQLIHGVLDVGQPKVRSAATTIAALSPDTVVHTHELRLTADNALHLFAGYDLVIDGSDNFATRYLANDAAVLTGTPLVWGAVSQYAGQAGVAWASRGPTYRDLFPVPPAHGSVLSCEAGGVLPSVCAVIGSIMTTETLKIITGIGEPLLGRVTLFDALTGSFRELPYSADPAAPPITELVDYEQFCGAVPGGAVPGGAVPGGAVPSGAVPSGAAPGGAVPGSGAPIRGEVTAAELAAEIAAGADLTLLDVREPWEAEIASLPGAQLVPLGQLESALAALNAQRPIVVYCHHGIRSATALDILAAAGITGARHLAGGIDAWSRSIDPALARY